MKKFVSLLLALAMLLPMLSFAETAVEPAVRTVDFGVFTLDLAENDYYEVAEKMVNNQLYLQVFPAYDATSALHPNFNIVWSTDDPSPAFKLYGLETYAMLVQQAAQKQYNEMGISMTDLQVLNTYQEGNLSVMLTSANMDYTGMGIDLAAPTYQMQLYLCGGEAGCYIFTITANTLEDVTAIAPYLDTIKFK